MRRLGRLVLVGVLATSCIVRVSEDESEDSHDLDNVDSHKDAGHYSEPCAELNALPEVEMERSYKQAREELEAAGVTLAEVWTEPERFEEFNRAAFRAGGCELPETAPDQHQSPLHSDYGPDSYCGPEHGLPGVFNPAVSTCLNEACRRHDACYARCSAKTGLNCMWGPPMEDCDAAFWEAANCNDDDHSFNSGMIRFIAAGVDALSPTLGCPGGVTCPGSGPCQLDLDGEACTHCLAEKDPGGTCIERACGEDGAPNCYLANCLKVAGCFGGYDVPEVPRPGSSAGGAGGQGPAEVEPDSLWNVYLIKAVVPETKPNGLPWDEGQSLGFAAPDPRIAVRFGSADAATSVQSGGEDDHFPDWPEESIGAATADALETFVQFTMWDADLVADDPIGSCDLKFADEDFSGSPREFVCFDSSGVERFAITYRLLRFE